MARRKEIAKPTNHQRGVRRLRTTALILSVTVPKVWPGPMIGGRWSPRLVRRANAHASLIAHPISGFGLRSRARYVVRGRVFSSPSNA